MSRFDWDRVRRDKDAHRQQSAGQPIEEKFHLLDRLRERDQPFRALRHMLTAPAYTVVCTAQNMIAPDHVVEQSGFGTLTLNRLGANETFVYIMHPGVYPMSVANAPVSEPTVINRLGVLAANEPQKAEVP
jgi:hypothetical protein